MPRVKVALNEHGLSDQQEAYCLAIVAGMSQIDAYRHSHPAARKWQDQAVYPKASVLSANDKVKVRIGNLLKKAAEKNDVTAERIIKEIALIAFGRKKDLMKWGPEGLKLIDSDTLTDDQAALVSEIKETVTSAGGTLSLKTHDKVKALELLGRHVGLFSDKLEVTGKDGGPIRTKAELAELSDQDLEAFIAARGA